VYISRVTRISGFGRNTAISGYQSLSQSPEHTFVKLFVIENHNFAVRISILTVVIPETKLFPVLPAAFSFPVSVT